MNTHCDLSASHQCENESGLRHFIKHGEIHGCAGCCRFCLSKDTCEYACAYVKKVLAPVQESAPAAPTFDFGADDQTNALLLQDAQTFITGNMARIMAAKHAHDLTANHYMGSWGKWCAAVGISRDTGDRMVSVAAQCGNIELEGKSILDVQPMKLLYAAAKPSTPEVVKQAVFSGDITTYKEYQDLMAQLKAEKERADSVEVQLEAAQADVTGLTEQNAKLQQSYHDADESRIAANLQRQKAEAERDRAEARAKDAENALKKQPITSVVDKDEVKRQVDAISRKAVQEAQADAAEAKAELAKFQQAAEGYLAPEQACAQQAKVIADAVRGMYLNWLGQASGTDTPLARMGSALYAVCGEIMSSLEDGTTIHPTAAGSEEDAEREALFE